MFAGDIRVKAGQLRMAPLNMRAENERIKGTFYPLRQKLPVLQLELQTVCTYNSL